MTLQYNGKVLIPRSRSTLYTCLTLYPYLYTVPTNRKKYIHIDTRHEHMGIAKHRVYIQIQRGVRVLLYCLSLTSSPFVYYNVRLCVCMLARALAGSAYKCTQHTFWMYAIIIIHPSTQTIPPSILHHAYIQEHRRIII